jgi:hypothetical protein
MAHVAYYILLLLLLLLLHCVLVWIEYRYEAVHNSVLRPRTPTKVRSKNPAT